MTRTDARACGSLEAALNRAGELIEACADWTFGEAPISSIRTG